MVVAIKFLLILLVFAIGFSMMCFAAFAPPVLNEFGKNINVIFILPGMILGGFGCYLINEFFKMKGE